jgi:hypothetical protein
MNVKYFIIISAVIALLFACVMTGIPLLFLQWIGFETGGFTLFLARDYATAMLAFALGFWLVRNEQVSQAVYILLLMWGVFHLAEVVVNLIPYLRGTLHTTSKKAALPFSLHIIFAFGSFYYLIKLRAEVKNSIKN